VRNYNLTYVLQSYRLLKNDGLWYTAQTFNTNFTVASVLEALAKKSIFSRGLPMRQFVQNPGVARVLRNVLRDGKVTAMVPIPFSDQQMDPALELCNKNGWLYHGVSSPTEATREYVFASPLHRRYVEWMLYGNPKGEIKEKSLTTFALAVIRHILPLNLAEPRNIGSSVQSIPEAQFQDEFYRACSSYTQNCVVSFPEFGTKHGRIDFFIPSKKWGIELLRNGDRLSPHIKRFTEGEYGQWIRDEVMTDYIVLDFRPAKPPRTNHESKCSLFISCHPTNVSSEINNLYYVVYKGSWEEVKIYNTKQEVISHFVPMHG
jgi:hypothetical protein